MGAPGTTSSPIRIEPQGEGARGFWLHDDDGEYLAMVCIRPDMAEELAHAHQFAASGVLYDALNGLFEMLRSRPDMMSLIRPTETVHFNRAANALAQARGEQP